MTRFRIFTVTGLILLATLTSGCQRTATEGPSPLGPSTFSLTFSLEARPNIIIATAQRPTSTLLSVVTENGQPAANRTVFFTIVAGPGEFGNFSQRAAVVTNASGIASISFLGPTKYEMTADVATTIMAQLQTNSIDVIAKTVDITILFNE